MARRIDPALTKRALLALKRAADKANLSPEGLSEWETDFLSSVEERLKNYGAAFADPDKGQLSAPLSLRQGLKVRQINRKGLKKTHAAPHDGKQPQREIKFKPRKPLSRKIGLKPTKFRPK
ncbi:hypothetical protein [Candidatus Phycosocius spiralis]|uniref:DNA-binding protein n=1 Tax=Candidatus Phycosocius spiralis TaxID=2815099 RepID=A0ABQ4PTB7_9PROT|nr:hypothetical protein [Candidatus Phycosocius spiralis]GIU66185.1 hypothetical protein PsB1_0339 [Candidatus Phycosocius spiralis]